MSLEAVRYGALILLTSIPLIHAYSHHRSHPKCTRIPAADVYRGTCYFQYVSGKGYVKRTCSSGSRYNQQACACISTIQKSRVSISTRPSSREEDDDDSHQGISRDKSSFFRNLFGSKPISLIKFLFSNEEDDDRREFNDFGKRGDQEEDDDHENETDEDDFQGPSDFKNYRFYGGESDDLDSGNRRADGENVVDNTKDTPTHFRSDDDSDLDDKNEADDDDDNEPENKARRYLRPFKHGYRSIYSVKGMLTRQKQYRYEDLFVNLFDDDDDNERELDDEYRIVKRYENIYDEKLDGVLEYVDDIFDDIFDDDFDDFYEDIFDDDGYDDCFVKRYSHYFEDDFENEIEEKYEEFDEFFKNYDRIKSLTSNFGTQGKSDNDDDDDNDDDSLRSEDEDEYGNSESHHDEDKEDDHGRGDDVLSGFPNFEIFENDFDDSDERQQGLRDSRLFDFSTMLKKSKQQKQPGNIFNSFYRRS